MRHVRRYIATVFATLIGFATLCVATSSTAFALRDPGPADDFPLPSNPNPPISADTPLWKFVVVAAIAALLTVAIVGLVASLRHARPSRQHGMINA
jgi:hypothetical protein